MSPIAVEVPAVAELTTTISSDESPSSFTKVSENFTFFHWLVGVLSWLPPPWDDFGTSSVVPYFP